MDIKLLIKGESACDVVAWDGPTSPTCTMFDGVSRSVSGRCQSEDLVAGNVNGDNCTLFSR